MEDLLVAPEHVVCDVILLAKFSETKNNPTTIRNALVATLAHDVRERGGNGCFVGARHYF